MGISPHHYIDLKVEYSGWQGVATDGKFIYVSSDRDENFALQNKISVYTMDGKYVKEKKDAYTRTDESERKFFMSFGDLSYIDGYLYGTVYNNNSKSGELPLMSRVVKFDSKTLDVIQDYEIGEGTAESVAKYKDHFWVAYHDRNIIAEFDKDFNLLNSYPLREDFEAEGGYQGIFFEGDELYANLHGSNNLGEKYAQGLDHYHFDGKEFKLVERIVPPTYGAGQGIEAYGGKYYWADRPSNRIIITESIK